jgi:drug/metabolite transporter (DMT)-like permease
MKKETSGEILILISCIIFSVMATLVKMVSSSFSGPFIALFRFASGIILGTILLIVSRQPFRIRRKWSWILRGIFGSASMVLYFIAIATTGSGRATLLSNTFPVFAALFGFFFFGEKGSASQIVSIALCIVGVGLVFYDGSTINIWSNLIALSVGVTRGLAVHFIKQVAEENHPIMVYLATCLFGLVVLPFTISEVTRITPASLLLLLLIGILALAAQILLGYGFRSVTATKASVITYASIPLTVFLGYCIGEQLRPRFLLGTAVIIVGLLVNSARIDQALTRLQIRPKGDT